MKNLKNFIYDDDGATVVEYALVVGLVAVAAIGVLGTFKGNVEGLFGKVATQLESVDIGGAGDNKNDNTE